MKNYFLSSLLLLLSLCTWGQDGQEQTWWGLWNHKQGLAPVGEMSAGTHNLAIRIFSVNSPLLVDCQVHGIRFYIDDKTAVKSAKAWISTTQFAWRNSSDVPNILLKEISVEELQDLQHDGQPTTVLFDQPYLLLPSTNRYANAYVGFTLELTDEAPCSMMTAGKLTPATNSNFYDWTNVTSDYGPLALQVLVSGESLKPNSMTPEGIAEDISFADRSTPVSISFINEGTAPVHYFDYSLSAGGKILTEKRYTLDEPLTELGASVSFPCEVPMPAEPAIYDIQLTVNSVNGEPNTSAHPSVSHSMVLLQQAGIRRCVMEEFTGTWCGNCPRGIVGMELLEKEFGDRFIGIAIHHDDPMTVKKYDLSQFVRSSVSKMKGYPSSNIDRVMPGDPYSGSTNEYHFRANDDIRKQLAKTTVADVAVQTTWNDPERTNLRFDVATTFWYTEEQTSTPPPYRLILVLTADGLSGATKEWAQCNYYSARYEERTGQPRPYKDDDLAFWKAQDEWVYTTYNHVAVDIAGEDGGIENSIRTPFYAGVPIHFIYSMDVSDDNFIQDKDCLNAIAMLLDTRSGEVINAAKSRVVPNDATDIGQMGADRSDGSAEQVFTLDGRRVQQPANGLFIVRRKDGTTQKVFRK